VIPPEPGASRPRSTAASYFRYCPGCAAALERRDIHGRMRAACPQCGFVQWRNPAVGVAGIVSEADLLTLFGADSIRANLDTPDWAPDPGAGRVLIVRRRNSRHTGWCIPCGWLEYDEDVRDGLEREIREETGIEVRAGSVFAVHSNFHDPDRQSVGIWFDCRPAGGQLRPGDDADRIRFLDPKHVDVPLAFPTDRLVLAALASRAADGR
jgi:8-oxo-dGTP diphosphatase